MQSAGKANFDVDITARKNRYFVVKSGLKKVATFQICNFSELNIFTKSQPSDQKKWTKRQEFSKNFDILT